MTKDRWQVVRNLQEVPMDVWFEYYKEKGGATAAQDVFEKAFVNFIAVKFLAPNGWVYPNFRGALNRLYKFYNEKFK